MKVKLKNRCALCQAIIPLDWKIYKVHGNLCRYCSTECTKVRDTWQSERLAVQIEKKKQANLSLRGDKVIVLEMEVVDVGKGEFEISTGSR